MNKKLKIAGAAVAVVMAGTMAFGMFGCGGGNGGGGGNKLPNDVKVDADGKLTWDAGTTINTAIGYNSDTTGIKLKSGNGKMLNSTLMGKSWSEGDLKPAWAAIQEKLNINLADGDQWAYNKDNGQSSSNLAYVKDNIGLNNVDVLTTGLVKANDEAVTNGSLLNLTDYLDCMPNYKNFLNSDVIRMSLMASEDGDMYIAPYFDGNDDIEKFVLLRKDIVEKILDEELPTTGDGAFNAQAGKTALTQTYVTAFMGSEDYLVDTTDPASIDQDSEAVYGNDKTAVTNNNTVKVKVNYTAALAAAKGTGALHDALIAAKSGLDTSALTSGNIIDLMNAVLADNVGVTGTQLINILRAYIDVAYTTESGAQFYSSTNKLKRSGVFNSACAAWDVDLYAALGRCYVSSGSMFNGTHTTNTVTVNNVESPAPKFLVSGRTNDDQRQSDMYSLVGELYGVRGLESRYNYSYVDKDGKLQDARSEAATWNAMDAFAQLAKEGLVNIGTDGANTGIGGGNYGGVTGYETLSLHDYVQTQTSVKGFTVGVTAADFNMAPVVTPVSKWDVDGNAANGKETVMRFTESWRSVKTEGIAVSANVKSDPNKLSAVLAFIDYIYSPDGQMVMTYGPQSTNGNTNPNGTWYAEKVTDKTADQVATKIADATNYLPAQYEMKAEYKGDYFVYNGEVYVGTFYNGRRIPTMTDENKALFKSTSNNFTNHARQNLGTCFPVGNKDQGFEYQCTANCGLAGSDIVNICLNNGTIKHQFQTVDKNNLWYMLVPTALPYDKATSNALSSGNLQYVSGLGSDTNTLYCKSGGKHANLFLRLMQSGYVAEGSITLNTKNIALDSATTVIAGHEGMATYMDLAQEAFDVLMDWYNAKN